MAAAIPAATEEPPAVTTVLPAVPAAERSAVKVVLAAERALPPGPRPAAGTADGRHRGPDEDQRDHSHDRVRRDAHGCLLILIADVQPSGRMASGPCRGHRRPG